VAFGVGAGADVGAGVDAGVGAVGVQDWTNWGGTLDSGVSHDVYQEHKSWLKLLAPVNIVSLPEAPHVSHEPMAWLKSAA
jgi:hypothetical protein